MNVMYKIRISEFNIFMLDPKQLGNKLKEILV